MGAVSLNPIIDARTSSRSRTGGGLKSCLFLTVLAFAFLLPALMPAQQLQFDAAKILRQPAPEPSSTPVPAEVISQGYLYVEPNLARFEVMLDATTVLEWTKLPVTAELTAEAQKQLTDTVAPKASGWCRVGAEQPGAGTFRGAMIVRGKPGATLPLEEGVTLPTRDAMVGLIWEFPLPPAPKTVFIEWTGYIQGQKKLPIRVFFGSKSEVIEAVPELKQLVWRSLGRLPLPAPLSPVPLIDEPEPMRLPVASVVWFAGGLFVLFFCLAGGHRLPGGGVAFSAAWLFGALMTWPLLVIHIPRDSDALAIHEKPAAEAILSPLLRNVYRAFDFRTESDIYDTLARSVNGELLRKLYLETLQALTLEGREGTRVTISEFSAEIMELKENPTGTGFIAECQWTALGTVGHWGHSHTRVNRYTAEVTVSPVKGEWKIVSLEVREARRI